MEGGVDMGAASLLGGLGLLLPVLVAPTLLTALGLGSVLNNIEILLVF